MALITCPECGKLVSDFAKSCVGCGYPYIQEEKERLEKIAQEEQQEKEREEQQKKGKLESSLYIDLPKGYRFEKNGEKFFIYKNDKLRLDGYFQYLHLKKIVKPSNMRNGEIILSFLKETIKLPIEDEKQATDICEYCGIHDNDERQKQLLKKRDEPIDNTSGNKDFEGIYKYTRKGGKQEVYCPRCGSADCSYFTEKEVIIPEKTKATYSANLNPLKPFTLVNKKEKVVRQDISIDVKKIICNKCGMIFK